MGTFSAVLRKSQRLDGDRLYVEFEPANPELKDVCYHGMTLPVVNSVAMTAAAYASTAASEMFIEVEKRFPNTYSIG